MVRIALKGYVYKVSKFILDIKIMFLKEENIVINKSYVHQNHLFKISVNHRSSKKLI